MLLPFTSDDWRGVIFRIDRSGQTLAVRWVSHTGIFHGEGMRDAAEEQALQAAFKKDDGKKVTRLYRTADIPEERCWLKGPDWCLAYS
jgi:protein-L-isoaspartate(D-aspartate) O-methyltransferase